MVAWWPCIPVPDNPAGLRVHGGVRVEFEEFLIIFLNHFQSFGGLSVKEGDPPLRGGLSGLPSAILVQIVPYFYSGGTCGYLNFLPRANV